MNNNSQAVNFFQTFPSGSDDLAKQIMESFSPEMLEKYKSYHEDLYNAEWLKGLIGNPPKINQKQVAKNRKKNKQARKQRKMNRR